MTWLLQWVQIGTLWLSASTGAVPVTEAQCRYIVANTKGYYACLSPDARTVLFSQALCEKMERPLRGGEQCVPRAK